VKPIDRTGRELDSIFSVEPTSGGVYLILESRGGPTGERPPRNSDYAKALELLLNRLGQESAVLTDVEVYSRETIPLPVEERRIEAPDFPRPLTLGSLTDAERERFRNQLGSASAALGRPPEKTSGGNPTKRLRLTLAWPAAVGRNKEDLEIHLAGTPTTSAEESLFRREHPTSDSDELVRRTRRAKRALQALGNPPPAPSGPPKAETTTAKRFVRDPNVIAWVLNEADGICEVCNLAAPFEDSNGDPFLEVHHVRRLADGGPDQADNAIAACPNCHRRLHLSADKEAVRIATIAKVKRLIDHPARSAASERSEYNELAALRT